MSDSRQTMIDLIDVERQAWIKNAPARKASLSSELTLINNMQTTPVIDKLVNIYNNDISNNEGPLTAIDVSDYSFLCSTFANARIINAKRFIYVPETSDSFRRNNKRTHTDIRERTNKMIAIQEYDSSCERMNGYQFSSMCFHHCNSAQRLKPFILCLIHCSTKENTLKATSVIPLYKVTIDG